MNPINPRLNPIPLRVQRRRTKGWRKPPNSVYVGRPTKYGNPFHIEEGRERAIAHYKEWIQQPKNYWPRQEARRELRGKNLACWCPPDETCHADVLLELVNRETGDPESFNLASWDSVEPGFLQASARLIGSLKAVDIRYAILQNIKSFPELEGEDIGSFSVSKTALLTAPNAAVIARFKQPLLPVGGMARLVPLGTDIIPVIMTFDDTRKVLVKHESIHLCQYLSPDSPILSHEEILSLIVNGVVPTVRAVADTLDRAVDLLARIVCYKIWIELEAYHWAEGQIGAEAGGVIRSAQQSAQPFTTLEQALIAVELSSQTTACQERLSALCTAMQNQVPLIDALLTAAGETSLLAAMWRYKEDDEMEMLLGPVENGVEESYLGGEDN